MSAVIKKTSQLYKDKSQQLEKLTKNDHHTSNFHLNMNKKHCELLKKIKEKKRVKVVFLVIHKSIWKTDLIFKNMLNDPVFQPLILVCPYTMYGEERMWHEMQECYSYFKEKNYPTIYSYNKENHQWITLEEIEPDILFFSNPHNLTRKEYYKDAYLNYLSCYVPYFFLTTTHDNDQWIYNQEFHNALWVNYMPHEFSLAESKKISNCKGKNSVLSGYPFVEQIINSKNTKIVWKKQNKTKQKIIFAPHHTISEDNLKLSNFLLIADKMKKTAEKYKDLIQWSFKPHPILKPKLYLNEGWGKEKTDLYYDFWRESDYTQLDEGEYINLFLQSDAIIHDSASFIAEYLFVKKPCGYLMLNGKTQIDSINLFGRKALESYKKLQTIDDITEFIDQIIDKNYSLSDKHNSFVLEYESKFFNSTTPSKYIISNLKKLIHR